MNWFGKLKAMIRRSPKLWYWKCYECPASGVGTGEQMHLDSNHHCLTHGHSVKGGQQR